MGGAHSLLLKALTKVEEGIIEWARLSEERKGAKPIALKWLTALEPEIVAYLTVKVLLDGVHQPRSVYHVSRTIAQAIEDELVYRELRAKKPALFDYLISNKFLTQHYRYNQRMLRGAVRSNLVDVSHLRIPKSDKIHVGTKCIDLAIQVTGLFRVELVNIRSGANMVRFRANAKRDQWQIIAEPATIEWIARKNDVLEWMTPLALPMVVPPLAWGPGGVQGGYRYGLRGKFDLVRGVSSQQQERVNQTHMPLVYQAVNLMQSTAWQVNPFIRDVVDAIAGLGGGAAGIPKLEPEPMPAKPMDIETNRESRRVWREKARATITRNTHQVQEALKFQRVMREADLVKDEPTLFFPYNLDFRGRMYPIATHLSPQGDDLCKGLLQFAEGKPLGEGGQEALAIHGANCMDTDPDTGAKLGQMALEDRFQWVVQHTNRIAACAENPLREMWWMDAEKPFQFLAFCKEWQGAVREGSYYVSQLPVYIDGSCNGLQHFSAMFRDEVGGRAVNLLPGDVPEDVYQRVADAVLRKCREVPDTDPDYLIARRWLSSGLLTRKLCKRPTMTFGYGSKVFGFQDQILEYLSMDLRESWERTKEHFTVDGQAQMLQAARFLARVIWEALQETVVKAFSGMEWLQDCAKVVCKSGSGVAWNVPLTNFPVKQEYMVTKKRRIKTILAGQTIRPAVYEPTARPLTKKQQNAVSPNVIHSLDAAALMLTVEDAMSKGVTSFSGIHDSYGCLAADMHIVSNSTRLAFTRLYEEGGVVGSLKAQMGLLSPAEALPEPPQPGLLDLEQVKESLYFFA